MEDKLRAAVAAQLAAEACSGGNGTGFSGVDAGQPISEIIREFEIARWAAGAKPSTKLRKSRGVGSRYHAGGFRPNTDDIPI